MAVCEMERICPFFNDNMPNMPADADYYRDNYCNENYFVCARYEISEKLGPAKVPVDMLPQELFRALQMTEKQV